jgi:hypothetical protein
MYSIITLHLCIRNITKENQEQSKTSFATRFYLFYIPEVDYKGLNGSVTSVIYHMTRHIEGLNGSVTSVIYHMTRHIECIRRKTISKHHAYIMSTT